MEDYGVAAFFVYLIGCFVFAMAGVGCRLAELQTPDGGGLEENLLGTV